ncbi:hypothetical protein C8R45DRAFT_921233 [Mycena sanguinolenta]|nr:hypothetical protein C8R45DRAFT_921233 [Mycena sanguinolenta]
MDREAALALPSEALLDALSAAQYTINGKCTGNSLGDAQDSDSSSDSDSNDSSSSDSDVDSVMAEDVNALKPKKGREKRRAGTGKVGKEVSERVKGKGKGKEVNAAGDGAQKRKRDEGEEVGRPKKQSRPSSAMAEGGDGGEEDDALELSFEQKREAAILRNRALLAKIDHEYGLKNPQWAAERAEKELQKSRKLVPRPRAKPKVMAEGERRRSGSLSGRETEDEGEDVEMVDAPQDVEETPELVSSDTTDGSRAVAQSDSTSGEFCAPAHSLPTSSISASSSPPPTTTLSPASRPSPPPATTSPATDPACPPSPSPSPPTTSSPTNPASPAANSTLPASGAQAVDSGQPPLSRAASASLGGRQQPEVEKRPLTATPSATVGADASVNDAVPSCPVEAAKWLVNVYLEVSMTNLGDGFNALLKVWMDLEAGYGKEVGKGGRGSRGPASAQGVGLTIFALHVRPDVVRLVVSHAAELAHQGYEETVSLPAGHLSRNFDGYLGVDALSGKKWIIVVRGDSVLVGHGSSARGVREDQESWADAVCDVKWMVTGLLAAERKLAAANT